MLRALMACAVCIALGMTAGWELSRKLKALRMWHAALQGMHVRCSCARETPQETLRAGAVHVKTLACMADMRSMEEIRQTLHKEPLPEEAVGVIVSSVQAVLNGNAQEQVQSLSFACAQLERLCVAAQKQHDRDAVLYVKLGVLGGVCMLLILM